MPWTEKLITSKPNDTQAPEEGRVLSYMEALHEALSLALELDPKVLILGQGVNDPKGMFGVTTGLHEKFGKDRVFDTPLSEEGMTGICTGASMNGLRPVYMHNRPDFLLLAFNQIVGHASKIHYMDNGETNVPLVIWSAIGRGWGSGSQHSQAIQGLLLGVPGLKIVMPSTPHDAKGLMLSAIADNNPVLIFEHRWSMRNKGVVPEGAYKISLGKGIYRRKGNDLTIVGTSHILELAIKAADELEGITADVIDLRTIKPLDEKIIIDSLQKTGRILIVDTGWEMGGVCAEIGCMVAEKGFSFLKGPVRRLGLSDIPSPAGFTLEQYYYPDVKKITHVIKDMVAST
ncbi:MAG TPA: alpha-ketoacid dehydrogenase subunit beta [Nitrospinaceae bacterium]|nr:alpha-ketoacid dehydrogenase subunit beta [Nitrospinaceae bacterium]